MTPIELRLWLEERGAIYGQHFTFGGLGDDVPGLEMMNGAPYTYRALRDGSYRKTAYECHASVEDACAALQKAAVEKAAADGVWAE